MDHAAKPTAMFFGFVAAAMTYTSAQAQPAAEAAVPKPAVERAASGQTSPEAAGLKGDTARQVAAIRERALAAARRG